MKYHTLFVIFEKAVKFEIVVCCKLMVALFNHQIKIKLIMPTQYCNVVFLQNCIIVVFVEDNTCFGEKLTCNPKVKIVSVKWAGAMKSQPIFNTSLE